MVKLGVRSFDGHHFLDRSVMESHLDGLFVFTIQWIPAHFGGIKVMTATFDNIVRSKKNFKTGVC